MSPAGRQPPIIVTADALRSGGLVRTYGLFGLVQLALDLLATRLLFRGARIVRRPFRIRGRGHIALGRRLTVGSGLRIDAFPDGGADGPVVRIGDDVELNDHVHIAAIRSVTIGDGTLIASRVFISDHNHGDLDGPAAQNGPDVPPALRPLAVRPVSIGSRVWIGEGALILPGATIGDGAIVAGAAVVTGAVPAGAVVAGIPARVVRQFDPATGRWERVTR